MLYTFGDDGTYPHCIIVYRYNLYQGIVRLVRSDALYICDYQRKEQQQVEEEGGTI